MRCLNGEIFARLVVNKPDEERCRAMGISNPKHVFKADDLASGRDIIFAAAGITDGTLVACVSSATAFAPARSSCRPIRASGSLTASRCTAGPAVRFVSDSVEGG